MGSGEMPLFCPLGGGGGTEGRTVGRVDTQVDEQWRDALVLSRGWGEGDRGAYRGESRHAG